MTVMDRTELDDVQHVIDQHTDVLFTWDYERSRPALVKLYEKAKTSQWNATTDLDWSIEVDLEKLAAESQTPNAAVQPAARPSPTHRCGAGATRSGTQFAVEMQTFVLSQFLHGEQGALVCTGLITATVPWIDAKYYAATQVMDEARHVEVFGRYIEEKIGGAYPINANLGVAARQHRRRRPVGHHLPRHADHGRGPRARRLRVHAHAHHRAAAQAAAPLRDERRGPPRRLRRAVAARSSTPGSTPRRSASARSSPTRRPCSCKHRFMSPDVFEKLGADPKKVVAFVEAQRRPGPADVPVDAVLEDRPELPQARASSTPATAGCAPSSRSSTSSSSSTASTPPRSTAPSTPSTRMPRWRRDRRRAPKPPTRCSTRSTPGSPRTGTRSSRSAEWWERLGTRRVGGADAAGGLLRARPLAQRRRAGGQRDRRLRRRRRAGRASGCCWPRRRSPPTAPASRSTPTSATSSPASGPGASSSASRAPAPTSPGSRPRRSATATSGSSTARRCGRRWARPPTWACCSPAPTPTRRSTRASPGSPSTCTSPASRSARCGR